MSKISNTSILVREHGIPFYLAAPSSAFDVTPAENIAAIISEKGTIRQPVEEKIRRMLGQKLWQKKTGKI